MLLVGQSEQVQSASRETTKWNTPNILYLIE